MQTHLLHFKYTFVLAIITQLCGCSSINGYHEVCGDFEGAKAPFDYYTLPVRTKEEARSRNKAAFEHIQELEKLFQEGVAIRSSLIKNRQSQERFEAWALNRQLVCLTNSLSAYVHLFDDLNREWHAELEKTDKATKAPVEPISR